MSRWTSTRAPRVLSALLRIGWIIKRTTGSHRVLARDSWPDVVFAFHDREEIGPKMLARWRKGLDLPLKTFKQGDEICNLNLEEPVRHRRFRCICAQ